MQRLTYFTLLQMPVHLSTFSASLYPKLYESRNQACFAHHCISSSYYLLQLVGMAVPMHDKNEWANEVNCWAYFEAVSGSNWCGKNPCLPIPVSVAILELPHSRIFIAGCSWSVWSSAVLWNSVVWSIATLLSSKRLFHTLFMRLEVLILSPKIPSSTDWFYFS